MIVGLLLAIYHIFISYAVDSLAEDLEIVPHASAGAKAPSKRQQCIVRQRISHQHEIKIIPIDRIFSVGRELRHYCSLRSEGLSVRLLFSAQRSQLAIFYDLARSLDHNDCSAGETEI